MTKLKILHSTEDESVNFVQKAEVGFFESRYVHRPGADYFIVYLSSQSGCNRGCGFCHLTTTGQTKSVDASLEDFIDQADQVLQYAASKDVNEIRAKYVHFNFMGRGEYLANTDMQHNDALLTNLGKEAALYGLNSKFNISTIMPKSFRDSLLDVFKYTQPTLYYSLYSINQAFRDKWLPGAMDVDKAMEKLKEYQEFTQKPIKIHFAFIDGQNDNHSDVYSMLNTIKKHELLVDFNIVRYNPPDENSQEPEFSHIQRLAGFMVINSGRPVQIVKRVGMDVKASCGMFVGSEFEV